MIELLAATAAGPTPSATFIVIALGVGVLAFIDARRLEVSNVAIVVLLAAAIVGLGFEGVSWRQWVAGLLSAAVAFLGYLALGQRGFMGGGDVKLVGVPALVLGAVNPMLVLAWLALAIYLQLLFALVAAVIARATRPATGAANTEVSSGIAHVPAMAIGLGIVGLWLPLV